MNRLVIIGNGFDLANGLKSRYADFLVYLINKEIDKANSSKQPSINILFSIVPNFKYPKDKKLKNIKSISEITNNPEIFVKNTYSVSGIHYFSRSDIPLTDSHQFMFEFNSELFETLFTDKKWTDIEHSYFLFLKDKSQLGNPRSAIGMVNESFDFIKQELINYLKSQISSFKINNGLEKIISLIGKSDRQILESFDKDVKNKLSLHYYFNSRQNDVLFLNFNYTNLLEQFRATNSIINKSQIINIHGNLEDPKNIIFGYGDEMNQSFREMEEANIEELLTHFKSYHYASQTNYFKLLSFIENPFDVIVIGHSLGLSDRLLLNTIFEHESCKHIFLFHRSESNHFRSRIALGRHFDNKKLFRQKLVAINESFKLPD